MNNFNYADPEPNSEYGLGLKKDYEIGIYANNFCSIDGKLYHYSIKDKRIILDQENGEAKKLSSATIDSVLAVIEDEIYIKSSNDVCRINKNGTTTTISIVTDTSTTDDENTDGKTDNETESTSDDITLPVAVLYQPQGNNGDPIVFAQSTNHIRLFYVNSKYRDIRFKNA